MPNTCVVPECKGNTKNGPKVHMFSFPNDPVRRQKWISAIPRKDFLPIKHSKVCEHHFIPEHIIRCVSQQDSKTGKILYAPLSYPRLHSDAIPSIFQNCPQYFSRALNYRQSRSEKLKLLEEQQLTNAIQTSHDEFINRQNSLTFDSYENFVEKVKGINLQQDWHNIIDNNKVTLFKIEFSPGPIISYSVVIRSNFQVETFLYGKILNFKDDSGLVTPFVVSSIDQLQNLLDKISHYTNSEITLT